MAKIVIRMMISNGLSGKLRKSRVRKTEIRDIYTAAIILRYLVTLKKKNIFKKEEKSLVLPMVFKTLGRKHKIMQTLASDLLV